MRDNDVVVRADSRINLITFCIGAGTQIKNESCLGMGPSLRFGGGLPACKYARICVVGHTGNAGRWEVTVYNKSVGGGEAHYYSCDSRRYRLRWMVGVTILPSNGVYAVLVRHSEYSLNAEWRVSSNSVTISPGGEVMVALSPELSSSSSSSRACDIVQDSLSFSYHWWMDGGWLLYTVV